MNYIFGFGTEVELTDDLPHGMREPAVGVTSTGNVYVAYEATGLDRWNNKAYLMLLDPDGARIGDPIQLHNSSSRNQDDVDLVVLPDDSVRVVYRYHTDPYMQHVLPDLTKNGTPLRIDDDSISLNYDPEIALSADDTIFYTYTAAPGVSGNSTDVYLRNADADGVPSGPPLRVNQTENNTQNDSELVALADGGFAITYNSHFEDGNGFAAMLRIYDSEGFPIGSEIIMNQHIARDQLNTDLAQLANGNIIATWQSLNQDGDGNGVYGRVFQPDGTPITDELHFSTTTEGQQWMPVVAALPDGGWVVVWSGSTATDGGNIYLQRYDGAGEKIGQETQVDAGSLDDDSNPAISVTPDGDLVIAWHRYFATADDTGGMFTRLQVAMAGTDGNDELNDTQGVDHLVGRGGNDTLIGNDGNDTIEGGDGLDVARIFLRDDAVTIREGFDHLLIFGDTEIDMIMDDVENIGFLNGTETYESLAARADDSGRIIGTSATENLYGRMGDEFISALDGNDWVTPGIGSDTINGGPGTDTINYSNLNAAVDVDLEAGTGTSMGSNDAIFNIENITGSIWDDTLKGDDGANHLRGLGHYDWFIATTGGDTIDGGNGLDMLSFLEWGGNANPVIQDMLSAGGAVPVGGQISGVLVDLANPANNANLAAGQTISSIERITGSSYQDVFYGDGGQNDFRGLGGYDIFVSSTGGRERYFGGDGIDTVTYVNAGAAIAASLRNGPIIDGAPSGYGSAGDALRDLYFSIENLVGSAFDDSLTGNDLVNQLNGLAGDDLILGYGGNDRLRGGAGNDTINGGAGSDFAIFNGDRSEYALTRTSTTEVTAMGTDGTDSLLNVEYFIFDDQTANIWELSII